MWNQYSSSMPGCYFLKAGQSCAASHSYRFGFSGPRSLTHRGNNIFVIFNLLVIPDKWSYLNKCQLQKHVRRWHVMLNWPLFWHLFLYTHTVAKHLVRQLKKAKNILEILFNLVGTRSSGVPSRQTAAIYFPRTCPAVIKGVGDATVAHFYTAFEGSDLSFSLVLAVSVFSCLGLDWGHVLTTVPPVHTDPDWPAGGSNRQSERTAAASSDLFPSRPFTGDFRPQWQLFHIDCVH